MKTLSEYTEQGKTEIFDKYGAFFAFSDQQFEEAKKDGVEYVSVGHGLICPKEHASKIWAEISEVHRNGIAQDLAENGKDAIIERELANHEAWYTGEIEDTARALEGYGFTEEDIYKVYREKANQHEDQW